MIDSDGCPEVPICVDNQEDCPAQTHDPHGCFIYKERNCEEEEGNLITCPPRWDSNGCQEAPFCLFNDENCKCPPSTYNENGCPLTVIDPHCDEGTHIKCEKSKQQLDQK